MINVKNGKLTAHRNYVGQQAQIWQRYASFHLQAKIFYQSIPHPTILDVMFCTLMP